MTVPELKTVDLGTGGISYREKGSGTPLVFVHGLGGRSEAWETQYETFSDRYRVIGWDMPGYGASTKFDADSPAIADYADALVRFADALEIERMHLVGHSIGTMIVTAFHKNHPDRLLSLTLAEAVTGSGMLDEAARAEIVRERENEIDSQSLEEWARNRAPRSVSPTAKPEIVARSLEYSLKVQLDGYKPAFRAMVAGNIFDDIAPLAVPGLIVAGADDRTATEQVVKSIADAMPGIRHEVIPDIGHLIFLEHPERFNAILEDFLGQAEAKAAA